jgi:hypothetical protein
MFHTSETPGRRLLECTHTKKGFPQVVEGVSYKGGKVIDTIDARSRVNGKQIVGDDKVCVLTRIVSSSTTDQS